jgi:hypothetical protein
MFDAERFGEFVIIHGEPNFFPRLPSRDLNYEVVMSVEFNSSYPEASYMGSPQCHPPCRRGTQHGPRSSSDWLHAW